MDDICLVCAASHKGLQTSHICSGYKFFLELTYEVIEIALGLSLQCCS